MLWIGGNAVWAAATLKGKGPVRGGRRGEGAGREIKRKERKEKWGVWVVVLGALLIFLVGWVFWFGVGISLFFFPHTKLDPASS